MIILDARHMEQKNEAHVYLKEKLGLPEYYGNNLDALYDCLTELGEEEILIKYAGEASAYFEGVLRVFRDAARENPKLKLCVE